VRLKHARVRAFLTFVLFGVLVLAMSPAGARRHVAPSPSPTASFVPAPAATPASQVARMQRLREELAEIARTAPGRLGVAVYDLATDERISVRGDEAFPLASVYKLAIAVTAYRLADQKRLALDERVVVTRGDLRHGASDIARDHPRGGVTLTYWQLVRAMLVTSDNTASDVVLRAVGGPRAVQGVLRRLHVRGLAIRKSEAELAADARLHRNFADGGDNGGTPNAVAELLVGLARQRFTLLDSTYELINALGDVQTGMNRLRAGLPPSVRLAHKTGTSDTIDGVSEATNDAGLLTFPDGRRIAAVALLAQSRADDGAREATLARVGRAIADAYAP